MKDVYIPKLREYIVTEEQRQRLLSALIDMYRDLNLNETFNKMSNYTLVSKEVNKSIKVL